MHPVVHLALALLISLSASASASGADAYTLGPDSQVQAGVPRGSVEKFLITNSVVFPGTVREAWVYVPAQYRPGTPAALMVFQDGGSYVGLEGQVRVPLVFDNLIHRGEMPVTIGLFLNPGRVPSDATGAAAPAPARSNRSFEYDSLGGAYARFLIEEAIPMVAKRYTLTDDRRLRALCGMSSGAICAFTAAWERPDYFSKVLSHIGSFVNIRGGHVYPAMIRKTERKPLRVFLQDGSNDLNNLHGDWPLANHEMASALRFAGYDFRFEFGDGGHNAKHAGAILPESLRWLWRPETTPPPPETKGNLGGDEALSKVLPQQGGWELVGEGYGFTDAACADAEGNFYFSDLPKGVIYRVGHSGSAAPWIENGLKVSGMKFGADRRLYAATQGTVGGPKDEKKKIVAIDPTTKEVTEIASDVQPNDLVVSKAGWVYFTDTGKGEVQMVATQARSFARPRTAAGGIVKPNGIALSPDHNFLAVSEYGGTNGWLFTIGANGELRHGERVMTLRVPEGRADSGGDGMIADAAGRFYITSHLGVQMFDSTGRMGGVILKPSSKGCVSVGFGGASREYLYICASDRVYRRPMLAQGAQPTP